MLQFKQRQCFGIIVAYIPVVFFGISISWISMPIPQFLSSTTPLKGGPLYEAEASWIVAGLCVGGILSVIVCNWITNFFGRRRTLILISVPQLIGWICMHLAKTGMLFFVGRVLLGMAGVAALILAPVIAQEICDENIGNFWSRADPVFLSVGILLGYVASWFINYQVIFVMEALCILYIFVIISFQKETPAFYLKNNFIESAERSARFYNREDQTIDLPQEESDKFEISYKAILLSATLAAFPVTSGAFVFLSFFHITLVQNNSTISIELSSVIAASVFLLGNFSSIIVSDHIGHRPQILFSAFSSSLCLLLAGLYFYIESLGIDTTEFDFVPLILISLLFFMSAVGLHTVPIQVIADVLPRSSNQKYHILYLVNRTYFKNQLKNKSISDYFFPSSRLNYVYYLY